MDIMVYAKATQFAEIVRSLGMQIAARRDYYIGTRNEESGRLRILFKQISKSEIYCDLHYDEIVHFLFLGVDYKQRPEEFFHEELESALKKSAIPYEVTGGFTWKTSRNKAFFKGLEVENKKMHWFLWIWRS